LAEVTISDLTYRYPHTKKPVLKGINLQVRKGEFVFITGKSGCGKSTLARTLNGTIPHILEGEMNGKVVVKGKNTLDHQVSEIAPDLGFIFQNPESQFFNLQVEDEVAFGPEVEKDFYNFEAVLKFINIIKEKGGINLSERNITLSTCGIIDKIKTLADLRLKITLAISLHSPLQEERENLMPIAKNNPLGKLIEAIDYYILRTQRRVTIEYGLIDKVNKF